MFGVADGSDNGHTRQSSRGISLLELPRDRVQRAKRSFTTRRVPTSTMESLVGGPVRPRSGDLVLARVDRIGNHGKLESPEGRRAQMHVGDEIIVTYADRYATDQFEAHVPLTLGQTQLVAAGGVASRVISRSRAVRPATTITPIGLVGDGQGVPLNVREFALPPVPAPERRPPTIAVLGTSMNSGKTTTAYSLVHAMAQAGRRPGATKVTGTGAGGDYWVMIDAGASRVLDFTDGGFASTFRIAMRQIEATASLLIDHLAHAGCDGIVVEVADGLLQRETAQLLQAPAFRRRIDGVIFAAGDAMGAIYGVERLRELGVPVVGVAGLLTRSPLAVREVVEVCDLPVFTLAELEDPQFAERLLPRIDTAPEPLSAPEPRGPDDVIDLTQDAPHRAGLVTSGVGGQNG